LLHPFFLLLLGLLDVAAKLMITDGSLAALASIPSCDVQLLGSKKMILAGYYWRPTGSVGYNIEQRDVVQATPPSL
jgi:U4/U6 small nuclear ribonucleoprotein PRP31